MEHSDIQKNTEKLLSFVSKKFENKEIDNSSLVQLIELCGMYLNLQTIPDYAKDNNLSYNGVKNNRNIVKMFNKKFVINNL